MYTPRKGNIWDAWDEAQLFVIPTNNTIKLNGELVMGNSTALEANKRFPGLSKKLGTIVSARKGNDYHFIVSPGYPISKLAVMQTKRHYRQGSDVELAIKGVGLLGCWLAAPVHQGTIVHMPYPAPDLSNFDMMQIDEWLEMLPPTVHVWTCE